MNLWADKDDNEGRLTGNLRGFTPRHYYNCDLGDKGEGMKTTMRCIHCNMGAAWKIGGWISAFGHWCCAACTVKKHMK